MTIKEPLQRLWEALCLLVFCLGVPSFAAEDGGVAVRVVPSPPLVARVLTAPDEEPEAQLPPFVSIAKLSELLEKAEAQDSRPRRSHLISFAASPRQQVARAQIDLVFQNGPRVSHQTIHVSLNNQEIAALSPDDPEVRAGRILLKLEGEQLSAKENFLQFSLNGDWKLDEVVDADRSRLILEGTWKALSPHLGMLGALFEDKVARRDAEWHLCFPGLAGHGHDAESLQWGALAAQGAALRMDDLSPVLSQGLALDPSRDNLVVGEARFLTGFLPEHEIQKISGPFLAVSAQPGAPSRLMIVLSGRTPEEVSKAAMAFGFVNAWYPDSKSVVIDNISLPADPVYIRKAPLFAKTNTTFKDLGFISKLYALDRIPEMDLDFDIDVWAISDEEKSATLHFDYWAPADAKGRVDFEVRANGTEVERITMGGPLPAPISGPGNTAKPIVTADAGEISADGRYRRGSARVRLPMPDLKAGKNRVSIIPAPVEAGASSDPAVGNFSLLDSSTLELSGGTPSIALPDLGLMSQAGFPFVPGADGGNLEVNLADGSNATITAAWMMMAKLAQVTNTLLYNAEIGIGPSRGGRQLLAVGAADELLARFGDTFPVTGAEFAQRMGNQGALFQSVLIPAEKGEGLPKMLTLLMARNVEDLPLLCQELVREDTWQRVGGDFFLWGGAQSLSAAQLVKPKRLYPKAVKFDIAAIDESEAMPFQLEIKPLYWLGILIAIAIPFALITRALIGSENHSRRKSPLSF